MEINNSLVVAVIEQAGVPPLRVGFTLAVIVFLLAGVLIWRRRHQFFDRDPHIANDVPVVRHNREEEILVVWGGLTLVLLGILYPGERPQADRDIAAVLLPPSTNISLTIQILQRSSKSRLLPRRHNFTKATVRLDTE
jgi:hypothetical protein